MSPPWEHGAYSRPKSQFLGSVEECRFFAPAALGSAPRAATVKDGRVAATAARSVLDGCEHGASLWLPGGRSGGEGVADLT